MKEIAALITFGRGGHTVHFFPVDNCTSQLQGYSTPDGFINRKEMQEEKNREYPIGTPVIDKIPALEAQEDGGSSLVWNMPLVSVKLPPKSMNRCPEPSEMLLMGLEGAFKTLARARKFMPKFTGLDEVDVETYVELWRRQGARIGKIMRGGKIKWEMTRFELIEKEKKKQLEFAL